MSQIVLWLLPAAVVLALLGIGAMGWLTGWRSLARAYPARDRRPGRSFRVPWIHFGATRYRNLVVGHADEAHLHLAVWLRIGHPPLSVPWREITASRERRALRTMVRLRFERAPEVDVWLSGRGATRLQDLCAGRLQWPGEVGER